MDSLTRFSLAVQHIAKPLSHLCSSELQSSKGNCLRSTVVRLAAVATMERLENFRVAFYS